MTNWIYPPHFLIVGRQIDFETKHFIIQHFINLIWNFNSMPKRTAIEIVIYSKRSIKHKLKIGKTPNFFIVYIFKTTNTKILISYSLNRWRKFLFNDLIRIPKFRKVKGQILEFKNLSQISQKTILWFIWYMYVDNLTVHAKFQAASSIGLEDIKQNIEKNVF